ncbi:hypothetical protein MHYP_G00364060 [Metynnis hypsauchen]
MLQDCLEEALDIQNTLLNRWQQTASSVDAPNANRPTPKPPVATSTPHGARLSLPHMSAPEDMLHHSSGSILPQCSLELSHTARALTTVLHQTKLEPPVFTGDGEVQPEEWLQLVNIYKTSLTLTDDQLLLELPRFLAREPRKWFTVLINHLVSWNQFCDLFKKVFLPADIQERILRSILDRFQSPNEPLPTFVVHMLSEFDKLRYPPPGQEQVTIVCRRALEKYRVALYGTTISSEVDLLMRAHELHSVLGPDYSDQPSERGKSKPGTDKFCFNCSLPGFTSRTCPNCRGVSSTSKRTDPASGNTQRQIEDESHCVDYGATDHGAQRKGNGQTGLRPENFRADGPPVFDDAERDDFTLSDFQWEDLSGLELSPLTLCDKVDSACLEADNKVQLLSLLEDFDHLFDGHLGHTSLTEHVINTADAKPVNLPPYRSSPAKKKIIEEQIQRMLHDGIIEPASGPWASPVVIVNRPGSEPRFCVDYRGLNQLTTKDSYPLPRVDESLDFLARGKFLTTLDLAQGYWQVSVEEQSKPKTAFISHCGLFQFRVLPFGLSNAPATFQRLMNNVLSGLIYKCCAVYLDDIVIASLTFEQHLADLREVLSRLYSAGLSLKLKKCQFCLRELTFLGYCVTPSGILPDLGKVQAVTDFKTPNSVKQVRQFLGLTSYYRRFIQDYARHAEPLFALTKHDSSFVWDEKCEAAMKFLKGCLTSAPVLRFPDFGRPFSIHTDASDAGLGAALIQKDEEGHDVAVAYASRTLHKAEKPYSTPEKECLAVIWALEYFRPYVEGLHVTIFTDHSSLKWLMSRPNPSGRLARWSLRLQDFDFSVVHKPGAKNKVPDALSHNPQPSKGAATDILPTLQ